MNESDSVGVKSEYRSCSRVINTIFVTSLPQSRIEHQQKDKQARFPMVLGLGGKPFVHRENEIAFSCITK